MGKGVKYLTGTPMMRDIGVETYLSLRGAAATEAFNQPVPVTAGPFYTRYFPSIGESERLAKSGKDAPRTNWGVDFKSPVPYFGWCKLGKAGGGANLGIIGGYHDKAVNWFFLGIPGWKGFVGGNFKGRPPFVMYVKSRGLLGSRALGLRLNYGLAVYSNRLEPVNRYVFVPLAKGVGRITEAVVHPITKSRPAQAVGRSLKRSLKRARKAVADRMPSGNGRIGGLLLQTQKLAKRVAESDAWKSSKKKAGGVVKGALLTAGKPGDLVGGGLQKLGRRLEAAGGDENNDPEGSSR